MDNRDWYNVDQATEALISGLEKHALVKLTELIDHERFGEACQVVSVLQGVGIY